MLIPNMQKVKIKQCFMPNRYPLTRLLGSAGAAGMSSSESYKTET